MFRKCLPTGIVLICMALLAACLPESFQATAEPNMANPASVFCEQNGGKVEMNTDSSGGTAGMCVFPDGSQCDEWAFFRGECKAGDAAAPVEPAADSSTPEGRPTASSPDLGEWKVYKDEATGLTFSYPPNTEIVNNDDPNQGISIFGPTVNSENWPAITINHPNDRPDFVPPDGTDLTQWLTDHYLTGDNRQPDLQIAGTTAIHFRFDRSQQSYAMDRFYFTRSGQLYEIIIGHTGDKEDWDLYNQFLESIQFEK